MYIGINAPDFSCGWADGRRCSKTFSETEKLCKRHIVHWLQIWPPGGSRYIELNVNRPLANGGQFWDFVSHQKVSTSFTFFCLHCKFFSLSCIIYVYLQCRTESVPAFVEKSAEVRTGSFLFPATRSLANKKNSFSSILNSMLQAILTTTSSTEEERRKVEERTIGQFFYNINQPGRENAKVWSQQADL